MFHQFPNDSKRFLHLPNQWFRIRTSHLFVQQSPLDTAVFQFGVHESEGEVARAALHRIVGGKR